MDYTVVYDASNEFIKLLWAISIPGILISIFYLNKIEKLSSKDKKDYTVLMMPGVIILLLSFIWGILLGIHQIGTYIEMKNVIKNESYLTIEGIVEDFDPMPYTGHKHESFRVGDIKFYYSDYNVEFYGFNNTSSHGGPINRNGLEVRINYFHEKRKNDRLILKLEIKE